MTRRECKKVEALNQWPHDINNNNRDIEKMYWGLWLTRNFWEIAFLTIVMVATVVIRFFNWFEEMSAARCAGQPQ